MKNILYLALAILLFACQDESEVTSRLELENLYTIRDNPNDSIQHRVYEIYQKYGVPVYFNDTIGKIFQKVNGRGDSTFIVEKLDLNWNFSSTRGAIFEYHYMQDPKVQSTMLNLVEKYLTTTSKTLHPFNVFLIDSAYLRSGKNIKKWGTVVKETLGNKFKYYRNIQVEFGFRTLCIAGIVPEKSQDTMLLSMIKNQVKQRIGNYQKFLDAFFLYSKKEWFGGMWRDLDKTVNKAFNCYTYLKDPKKAAYGRSVIGKFGFVGGAVETKMGGPYSPEDNDRDLDLYLNEMLKQSRDEFVALWGDYPLVMKKYEVLYDIIVNKMKVELK